MSHLIWIYGATQSRLIEFDDMPIKSVDKKKIKKNSGNKEYINNQYEHAVHTGDCETIIGESRAWYNDAAVNKYANIISRCQQYFYDYFVTPSLEKKKRKNEIPKSEYCNRSNIK